MNYWPSMFLCILIVLVPLSGQVQQQDKTIPQRTEGATSMGAVLAKDAKLHYVIEGKGIPCLVIAHAESSRLLRSQELKHHFQFIFMDLRHDARSRSSLEVSKITLDTYLDDIDAVNEALGLGKCAIWGHSHYAYVAFKYAQKYPSKVSRIIMTACTPCDLTHSRRDEFWESDASNERKTLFAQKWGLFLQQRPEMTAMERHIATHIAMASKLLYDPDDNPLFIESVKAFENDTDIYLHYMLEILKDYDFAEERPQVTVPVFLALGRYDYIAPYILWDERKNTLPNLSYHLFQKSGHFPMIEEPESFNKRLIEWIDN